MRGLSQTTTLLAVAALVAGCDPSTKAFEEARAAGTLEAWQDFLARYPDSRYAADAARVVDSLAAERRGFDVTVLAAGPVTFDRQVGDLDGRSFAGMVLRLTALRPGAVAELTPESVTGRRADGTIIPLEFVQPLTHRAASITAAGADIGIPRPYGGTIMTQRLGEGRSITMYAGFLSGIGGLVKSDSVSFQYPFVSVSEAVPLAYQLAIDQPVELGVIFAADPTALATVRFLDLDLPMPTSGG